MALRDTQSYESQIIDAVRSVNKALGGTYGTSSAIYKNEFNQYEVQLIDAIRGISRTLSGKGLVIGSGEVEEVDLTGIYEQLTSLSRRVKTLEDESFFRLVDGNITLKEGYNNLWVPGFLAAGGIGSSSSGGVTKLRELDDVYHDTSSVLRANGTAVVAGDTLVYNSTHGWVAAAPGGGGGGSTVSVTQIVSSGTKIATITVDGADTDLYAPSGGGGGGSTVSWGTPGSDYVPLTVDGTTKNLLTEHQSLSNYVTLDGTQTITGAKTFSTSNVTLSGVSLLPAYNNTCEIGGSSARFASVYGVNEDLAGNLSMSQTSTINLGPVTISYDSTNKALHVSGTDGGITIGLYCDGWVAAGGVQSSS